jgi:hypothetical protein
MPMDDRPLRVQQEHRALEARRAKERAAIRRAKINERFWLFIFWFILVMSVLPVVVVVGAALLVWVLWRQLRGSLQRRKQSAEFVTAPATRRTSRACVDDRPRGPNYLVGWKSTAIEGS